MEFKKLEKSAIDGLSTEERAEYFKGLVEYTSESYETLRKEFDELKKSNEDDEKLKDLQGTLNKTRDEILAIHKTHGIEIAKLKKSPVANVTKTVVSEIIEKAGELKEAIIKNSGKDIEIKALTNLASVANNAQGFFLPEITQLGHKERSLYNVLPKVNVSDSNTGGVVRYRDWDEATTVRAAAMVAEGATFPESTAKFEWYSKPLRKVGDTLPVTEEFFEDEAQAANELDMFLQINVNLEIDSQLVTGDNTGQNLDGIINSAPAYTPVASGIASPNLKDLSIKVRNDITRTRGSKYKPDMVLVNSNTMEGLVLAKDANNNYIFDENTGTLGGMFVVVDENTPDNQMVIGDRRYARIYERTGVILSKGIPNAQFLEDEMTIKARKRMLLLIKEGDKVGFRKVTSISAALVTIGS